MNKTWFVPPIVVPILIGPRFGGTYDAPSNPLISREAQHVILPLVPLNAAADEQSLAHDMIEVHGAEAAAVARANARTAALAAQMAQAKSWIRILGIIQRHLTDKAISLDSPKSFPSIPHSTKG